MKTNKTIRRPLQKPRKPPTPAARKGGRKKENVGAGRSAYGDGGLQEQQMSNLKKAQASQGTLKQEKVGQRRPSDRIPKMQTVTLAKPKPQESKVRKRPGMVRGGLLSKSTKTNPRPMTATMQKKMPVETSRSKRPGFAHGGKVEMASLKPN